MIHIPECLSFLRIYQRCFLQMMPFYFCYPSKPRRCISHSFPAKSRILYIQFLSLLTLCQSILPAIATVVAKETNHSTTPPIFILLFKGAHLNIADSVPYMIAIRGNPTSSPIDIVPIVVIPGANFTKNAIATDTITITATKRANTSGLMRRMVKEDLLTFEGKPLFPERKAYTVEYELSPAERELYELVTDYVRTEMGRAERIAQAGDKKRGNNVGFALTVLQRRLASSPEAILRSLERRQQRLDTKLRDMQRVTETARLTGTIAHLPVDDAALPAFSIEDFEDFDEETTDEERAQWEEQADQVVDLATAAQTIPELRAEIAILEDLIKVARRVRLQDDDKKWVQLRTILDEQLLTHDGSGDARKIRWARPPSPPPGHPRSVPTRDVPRR